MTLQEIKDKARNDAIKLYGQLPLDWLEVESYIESSYYNSRRKNEACWPIVLAIIFILLGLSIVG